MARPLFQSLQLRYDLTQGIIVSIVNVLHNWNKIVTTAESADVGIFL